DIPCEPPAGSAGAALADDSSICSEARRIAPSSAALPEAGLSAEPGTSSVLVGRLVATQVLHWLPVASMPPSGPPEQVCADACPAIANAATMQPADRTSR